jgi:hypothetical protein
MNHAPFGRMVERVPVPLTWLYHKLHEVAGMLLEC